MRLFTLEEAQALLPVVVPVLERLRNAFTELRTLQAAVEASRRGSAADGALTADPWSPAGENRMEQLNARVRAEASRLDAWGIEVKDPATGLIDFRARRDGRVVYLCYRLGEPSIAHWHTLESGFAGRQPL
ncbi:MAG: DUF2203 domain-containing protein [Dehalococcoidia bacterium]